MWAAAAPPVSAQITETYSFSNVNRTLPDGNAAGLREVKIVSSTILTLSAVTVRLRLAGEFNGDLFGYLRHIQGGVTNFCVLLNRPGRSASNPAGYADAGLNVLFDDSAAAGDIHAYGAVTNLPAGSPLTGAWQPDGRAASPGYALTTTPRTTSLSSFRGRSGSGEWTLFLADQESGGTNFLLGWDLNLAGAVAPALAWSAPADITYGSALSASQLNASCPAAGSFAYTPALGALLNAGPSQALTVVFTPSDTNSYLAATTSVSLNVLKKTLAVTANDASGVYGAALPALGALFSGFVNGDTTNSLSAQPVVSTAASSSSPAGAYPVTAASAAASNYAFTYTPGTLTLAKAPLTITAVNKSKTYGAALPVFSAAYSGFVNGDTTNSLSAQVVLSTSASASSPAGAYPISASAAASANYTITHAPGTLTIDKAALMITALSTNKVYGAALPVFSVVYSGFVNGDTTNSLTAQGVLSTTATASSPAGSYPISVSGAAGANYAITHIPGTLTIDKAALTIAALSTNKVYGAALPVLSATYSGFVNGETTNNLSAQVVLSTTATASSPAGAYPISASGAAGANYAITHTPGTLAIDKAALTIAALSTNKVYGAALPVFSAAYSGFVNGDTTNSLSAQVVLSTTASASSPAGAYPISASAAAGANYAITHTPGTLTIAKAALTIAAANKSKTYGAALPVLSATYSGFVNGDTTNNLSAQVVLSTTASASSPAGSYSISAGGAASTNYTLTHTPGTLTIDKAALTITALSTNKIYGAPLPVFSAAYSGFVNGDTTNSLSAQVVLSTSASASSPAGFYSITPASAAGSNYTFAYVPGALTIGKGSLAGLLASSANPAQPGQTVAFTHSLAAVAPAAGLPSGSVQFKIDGTNSGAPAALSAGAASLALSTLALGTHSVAAEYAGDGNFTGVTNTLAPVQLINTPPVAGADSLQRYPTNGVKVSIAALLANDSDADGDTVQFLSVSASSTGGGLVVSNGAWICFTPAAGATNTDTFTYLISDGRGSPVTGTVTITVAVADGVWPPNLTAVDLGNGVFRVAGDGVPGCTYRIQYTSDIQNPDWQPLGAATANPFGAFVYLDDTGSAARFYRAVWP